MSRKSSEELKSLFGTEQPPTLFEQIPDSYQTQSQEDQISIQYLSPHEIRALEFDFEEAVPFLYVILANGELRASLVYGGFVDFLSYSWKYLKEYDEYYAEVKKRGLLKPTQYIYRGIEYDCFMISNKARPEIVLIDQKTSRFKGKLVRLTAADLAENQPVVAAGRFHIKDKRIINSCKGYYSPNYGIDNNALDYRCCGGHLPELVEYVFCKNGFSEAEGKFRSRRWHWLVENRVAYEASETISKAITKKPTANFQIRRSKEQQPENVEKILKAITVDEPNLSGLKVYHGTIEDEITAILNGPKNIGKGYGGAGLYVDLDKSVAESCADDKSRASFHKDLAVMEGVINPNKTYRVARIHIAENDITSSKVNYEEGIFNRGWAKENPDLQKVIHENFDIVEIYGALEAGHHGPSDRFLVIHESAGADAIVWNSAVIKPGAVKGPLSNSSCQREKSIIYFSPRNSKKCFGTDELPKLYANTKFDDVRNPLPPIEYLKIDEILKTKGACQFNYIIHSDGRLVIADLYSQLVPFSVESDRLEIPEAVAQLEKLPIVYNGQNYLMCKDPDTLTQYLYSEDLQPIGTRLFVNHAEMACGQPVVGAGCLFTNDGRISHRDNLAVYFGVDNHTGHYLCEGDDAYKKMVEYVFKKAGFNEAAAKFQARSLFFGKKSGRTPNIIDWDLKTTLFNNKSTSASGDTELMPGIKKAIGIISDPQVGQDDIFARNLKRYGMKGRPTEFEDNERYEMKKEGADAVNQYDQDLKELAGGREVDAQFLRALPKLISDAQKEGRFRCIEAENDFYEDFTFGCILSKDKKSTLLTFRYSDPERIILEYAVLTDGKLSLNIGQQISFKILKRFDPDSNISLSLGHAKIAEGYNVILAGDVLFNIKSGKIDSLNNDSGHFKTNGAYVPHVTKYIFNEHGFAEVILDNFNFFKPSTDNFSNNIRITLGKPRQVIPGWNKKFQGVVDRIFSAARQIGSEQGLDGIANNNSAVPRHRQIAGSHGAIQARPPQASNALINWQPPTAPSHELARFSNTFNSNSQRRFLWGKFLRHPGVRALFRYYIAEPIALGTFTGLHLGANYINEQQAAICAGVLPSILRDFSGALNQTGIEMLYYESLLSLPPVISVPIVVGLLSDAFLPDFTMPMQQGLAQEEALATKWREGAITVDEFIVARDMLRAKKPAMDPNLGGAIAAFQTLGRAVKSLPEFYARFRHSLAYAPLASLLPQFSLAASAEYEPDKLRDPFTIHGVTYRYRNAIGFATSVEAALNGEQLFNDISFAANGKMRQLKDNGVMFLFSDNQVSGGVTWRFDEQLKNEIESHTIKLGDYGPACMYRGMTVAIDVNDKLSLEEKVDMLDAIVTISYDFNNEFQRRPFLSTTLDAAKAEILFEKASGFETVSSENEQGERSVELTVLSAESEVITLPEALAEDDLDSDTSQSEPDETDSQVQVRDRDASIYPFPQEIEPEPVIRSMPAGIHYRRPKPGPMTFTPRFGLGHFYLIDPMNPEGLGRAIPVIKGGFDIKIPALGLDGNIDIGIDIGVIFYYKNYLFHIDTKKQTEFLYGHEFQISFDRSFKKSPREKAVVTHVKRWPGCIARNERKSDPYHVHNDKAAAKDSRNQYVTHTMTPLLETVIARDVSEFLGCSNALMNEGKYEEAKKQACNKKRQYASSNGKKNDPIKEIQDVCDKVIDNANVGILFNEYKSDVDHYAQGRQWLDAYRLTSDSLSLFINNPDINNYLKENLDIFSNNIIFEIESDICGLGFDESIVQLEQCGLSHNNVPEVEKHCKNRAFEIKHKKADFVLKNGDLKAAESIYQDLLNERPEMANQCWLETIDQLERFESGQPGYSDWFDLLANEEIRKGINGDLIKERVITAIAANIFTCFKECDYRTIEEIFNKKEQSSIKDNSLLTAYQQLHEKIRSSEDVVQTCCDELDKLTTIYIDDYSLYHQVVKMVVPSVLLYVHDENLKSVRECIDNGKDATAAIDLYMSKLSQSYQCKNVEIKTLSSQLLYEVRIFSQTESREYENTLKLYNSILENDLPPLVISRIEPLYMSRLNSDAQQYIDAGYPSIATMIMIKTYVINNDESYKKRAEDYQYQAESKVYEILIQKLLENLQCRINSWERSPDRNKAQQLLQVLYLMQLVVPDLSSIVMQGAVYNGRAFLTMFSDANLEQLDESLDTINGIIDIYQRNALNSIRQVISKVRHPIDKGGVSLYVHGLASFLRNIPIEHNFVMDRYLLPIINRFYERPLSNNEIIEVRVQLANGIQAILPNAIMLKDLIVNLVSFCRKGALINASAPIWAAKLANASIEYNNKLQFKKLNDKGELPEDLNTVLGSYATKATIKEAGYMAATVLGLVVAGPAAGFAASATILLNACFAVGEQHESELLTAGYITDEKYRLEALSNAVLNYKKQNSTKTVKNIKATLNHHPSLSLKYNPSSPDILNEARKIIFIYDAGDFKDISIKLNNQGKVIVGAAEFPLYYVFDSVKGRLLHDLDHGLYFDDVNKFLHICNLIYRGVRQAPTMWRVNEVKQVHQILSIVILRTAKELFDVNKIDSAYRVIRLLRSDQYLLDAHQMDYDKLIIKICKVVSFDKVLNYFKELPDQVSRRVTHAFDLSQYYFDRHEDQYALQLILLSRRYFNEELKPSAKQQFWLTYSDYQVEKSTEKNNINIVKVLESFIKIPYVDRNSTLLWKKFSELLNDLITDAHHTSAIDLPLLADYRILSARISCLERQIELEDEVNKDQLKDHKNTLVELLYNLVRQQIAPKHIGSMMRNLLSEGTKVTCMDSISDFMSYIRQFVGQDYENDKYQSKSTSTPFPYRIKHIATFEGIAGYRLKKLKISLNGTKVLALFANNTETVKLAYYDFRCKTPRLVNDYNALRLLDFDPNYNSAVVSTGYAHNIAQICFAGKYCIGSRDVHVTRTDVTMWKAKGKEQPSTRGKSVFGHGGDKLVIWSDERFRVLELIKSGKNIGQYKYLENDICHQDKDCDHNKIIDIKFSGDDHYIMVIDVDEQKHYRCLIAEFVDNKLKLLHRIYFEDQKHQLNDSFGLKLDFVPDTTSVMIDFGDQVVFHDFSEKKTKSMCRRYLEPSIIKPLDKSYSLHCSGPQFFGIYHNDSPPVEERVAQTPNGLAVSLFAKRFVMATNDKILGFDYGA